MEDSAIVWANRTMIVTAGDADLARVLCSTLSGEAGAGMFNTGLSADGLPPATHFISAGWISQGFADLLPLTTVEPDGRAITQPGNPVAIVALAESAGMTVTVTQVTGMLDRSDVTDGEPLPRMAELGLKLSEVEVVNA